MPGLYLDHVHVALVLASYSIIVSFILALVLNLHLFSLTSRVFLSFDSRHRDRDVYFYRCCYTVVCKRLAGASWTGPRPAFRWCLDLHVWPRFRLPNGKRVSPFLAPFFVSLFSLHRRPVPWHASICTHGRPWSREHCVALLGLAARSLQQLPILFSSRVYICRVLILSQFPFFIDRWSCPMLLLFFLFYRRSTSIKLLLGSSKM